MGDMVLSAFFFAVMAAAIKVLGRVMPLQELIFFRALGCVLMTYWWVRRKDLPVLGKRPGVLAARGAFGHLALSCYAWSLSHQPLAEAVLLQQVSPLFTAILAFWLLREPAGKMFVPAFVLAVAGVALLLPAGPTAVARHPYAPAVALLGALLSSGAYVAVRDAVRTEHPMTIVLWFPFVSLAMSVPGMALEGVVLPHGMDWVWLFAVALSGQFGQVFLTRGLSKVPAGRATLANPLTTAFGAVFGWLAFEEAVGWNTLAGGSALIAAILLAGQARRGQEHRGGAADSDPISPV